MQYALYGHWWPPCSEDLRHCVTYTYMFLDISILSRMLLHLHISHPLLVVHQLQMLVAYSIHHIRRWFITFASNLAKDTGTQTLDLPLLSRMLSEPQIASKGRVSPRNMSGWRAFLSCASQSEPLGYRITLSWRTTRLLDHIYLNLVFTIATFENNVFPSHHKEPHRRLPQMQKLHSFRALRADRRRLAPSRVARLRSLPKRKTRRTNSIIWRNAARFRETRGAQRGLPHAFNGSLGGAAARGWTRYSLYQILWPHAFVLE
ncbi:hypothetical protein BJV78DRAFT_812769 [Lactifluus subvellereus]|nr:hypothetical protein BJV78DRAFT_812769 [Lactifluus subvellereus]